MSEMGRIYTVKMYDMSPDDVHIDAALSNLAIDYRPQGFIADQIFPIVPVSKKSDNFYVFNQGDKFRETRDYRVPGQPPNMVSFDVSSDGYNCVNYALGTYITAEEAANADVAIRSRQRRANFITDLLLINYELRVARMVTSTSNVGTYTTTASAWGTDNADPYEDAQGDIAMLEDISGYKANLVVFGKTAWRKFRDSKEIRELLYPHGGGIPKVDQVATLLEVDKVLVGGAYYNTAAKGATMALSQIWNDSVLYAYIPPKPAIDVPSFGYSFRWTVPNMPNWVVRVFPFDPKAGRQDIHVGYYQDEKIIDSNLAVLRVGVGSSQ